MSNKKNQERTFTKKEENTRTTRNLALGALFVLAIIGIGSVTNWWGFGPNAATTAAPTTYEVVVNDVLDPSNTPDFEDDITYAWYEKDATGLTSTEITDLLWADFVSAGDSDNIMDPEADHVYILKCSGTDIVTRYFVTSALLFNAEGEGVDVLQLGINQVYMCNESEDTAELYHTTETGLATFAGATYRYWDIDLFFLDASESATADVTEKEGFMSYYSPETALLNGVGIMIHLNETDAAAFSVIGTYGSVSEDVVSDGSVHSMCLINGLFTGRVTIQIRLALAVTDGTADHAVTVSAQVGTMAGADGAATFTTLDTQV